MASDDQSGAPAKGLGVTAFYTAESFERALSTNLGSIRNVLETGDDERIVNPDFRQQARWLPTTATVPA